MYKGPHLSFVNFMMMVIDNVIYLIIYFYLNIMLAWRHLWCYLVTFVVLSQWS